MAFKFDKDKIQESTDFFERWLGPKPASSQPEVDIHQLRNVPLANLLTNTFLQDHTAYASQADLAAQLGLVDIEALKDWPEADLNAWTQKQTRFDSFAALLVCVGQERQH